MSLTLQPVSSNFFLLGMGEPGEVEAAIMSARVRTSLESAAAARNRSLESINRNAIKEELTNQWLEDCKNRQKIPFVKRLHADTAKLGTTFPPRGGLYPVMNGGEIKPFGRRSTFHSEPDLSPQAAYSDDDESVSMNGEEDEDHLFEFDMSPERDLEDLEEAAAPSKDHRSRLMPTSSSNSLNSNSSNSITAVAANAGSANNLGCELRVRTYSDSSNGSCSHRKPLIAANGAGSGQESESEDNGARYRAGFSSIFGSTSSGLGSEKRTSQETLIFGEEVENKSFEPSEWRDYMTERLSCSEGTLTPLSSSAPDLSSAASANSNSGGSNSSSVAEGGGGGIGTPILAASPCPPLAGGGLESPLISPDSLLEGQHLEESYLAAAEEAAAAAAATGPCPECDRNSLELASLSLCDKYKNENQEEQLDKNFNSNKTKTSISKSSAAASSESDSHLTIICTSPANSDGISSPDTSKKICEKDLSILLNQLDEDNHIYPGLHHVNSAGSQLSQDELGEDITPFRKNSAPAKLHSTTSEQKDPPTETETTPRLKKCSSLRTGRTPPGTPGSRKIVRFADIFGLDLSEVKTFVDEIPKVPRSAFKDLDIDMSDFDVGSPKVQPPVFKFKSQATPNKPSNNVSESCLVPMFTQPGCSPSFYEQVRVNKVSLENAYMEAPFVIGGVVRVLNLDFNKTVRVRWTVNDWHSHEDVLGTYVEGSSDVVTDKFSFKILVGCLPVGSRVQFCVQYCSPCGEFWDNNNGSNYVFQVFLNTNSPGGSGGVIRGVSPPGGRHRNASAPVISSSRPIPASAYRSPAIGGYNHIYTQSPSVHGDDPWMRFM